MAMRHWGLDLGYWSLKVARGTVDPKSGRIAIDLYEEIEYDGQGVGQGAPSLERFRAGLRAFGEKFSLEKKDTLSVAVSGSEVFSRFINLPPVPESINEIIRYEARQQIPFDMREVVWDYQPLQEEYQPGEEIEVGLFALKRETVGELMEMLSPWRDNLRVVQDAPLAVYNFLRFEGWVYEPLIVLDVGAHTTDVLILNHPRFWIRPLLVAGDDIAERLQSHFEVSPEGAEHIKVRASEAGRETQVLRAIRPVVGSIISEVQRSIGYYKSLARGVRFEKVLALGSAFQLQGLDRLLAEGLQYEIERLTELREFDLAEPLTMQEFLPQLGGASAALGLVLQGCGKSHMNINLVPEELTRAKSVGKKKPWVAAAAVAVLAMGIIALVSERARASDLAAYSQGPDSPTTLLKEIDRITKPYADQEPKTEEIKEELANLCDRSTDRDVLMRIVPLISRGLPEDVFVRSMEVAWNGERLSVNLVCETESRAGVQDYVSKKVKKSVQSLLSEKTGKPVFLNVVVSERLRRIWRNILTGKGVKPGKVANPDIREYGAFTVNARIDTGEVKKQGKKSGGRRKSGKAASPRGK
ncbi:MAG: pilus assembly protein PilM [Candidatus Brocadiia bacterium]|nr:pilus assembly protein PilM [Candidatus Brocadiia bacterium]